MARFNLYAHQAATPVRAPAPAPGRDDIPAHGWGLAVLFIGVVFAATFAIAGL
jgi:hypothetical protein